MMGNLLRTVSALLVLAGIVLLAVSWRHGTQHWLTYHTGSQNTSGAPPNYNFWSGFGSDLGEYTIAAGLFGHIAVAWRTHTCHRYWWCWRSPRHPLDGTPYMLCARHHPCPPPAVADAVKAASVLDC
jgi:hypothetical protein